MEETNTNELFTCAMNVMSFNIYGILFFAQLILYYTFSMICIVHIDCLYILKLCESKLVLVEIGRWYSGGLQKPIGATPHISYRDHRSINELNCNLFTFIESINVWFTLLLNKITNRHKISVTQVYKHAIVVFDRVSPLISFWAWLLFIMALLLFYLLHWLQQTSIP